MKKLILVYSLAIISTFILVGCVGKHSCCKNNKTKGTKEMKSCELDSGLKYEILKEGTGASPKKGQRVTVHYTGWLLTSSGDIGRKFDSSLDRGQAFSFTLGVGQVIKGWDEGVSKMKIGEKARFIIPSKLGYGAYGAGSIIPPHADLVFDVELLAIS